ncbi:alpha/beta fold hydrolase [Candidatus Micrarchaeota archaeon]|nr:alpha/beta fold hydrolase [Candidatus Micrarchaeota archaeon]
MFDLVQTITKDAMVLVGISSMINGQKTALIYIHGLGGDFHSNPEKVKLLARECEKRKVGFFIFNTRGSGQINGVKKLDKSKSKGYSYAPGGMCYERFEECIFDIDAMVRLTQENGYVRVVLAGHSTGANKVAYYLSKKPHRSVIGAILSGAVSDVPMFLQEKNYRKWLKIAAKLVRDKKGEGLMPQRTAQWPICARRFLSLATEGSSEDVFQYYREKPDTEVLSKINVPTLFIMGEKDEYATIEPKKILEFYRRSNKKFETKLVRDTLHSFNGKENELANEIGKWIGKFER